MDKQTILSQIRKTAAANGGVPLGFKRFEQETGIRHRDWFGKLWGRWSDALEAAGFSPNTLQPPFSDGAVLEQLIGLTREIGRFPGRGDMRLKKRSDPSFPNAKVFAGHFGSATQQRKALLEYCRTHPGFDDIPALLAPFADSDIGASAPKTEPEVVVGFVYLMKHGKHYKIGKTNATGRREYELAIQLPEKLKTVHVIRTDDPNGIEAYWHKRFGAKRGNGEWFELGPEDVQAFRRRKYQ
jgi:hypothetical protein